MSQHNKVGKIGEGLAKEYLKKQGYKIIEQNYKTRYAEIDLIAKESAGGQDVLVFFEVRTKIGENLGSPEDTLNKNKLRKILQNSLSYLAFKKWQGPARIDAVCIVLNSGLSVNRITHHLNIIS